MSSENRWQNANGPRGGAVLTDMIEDLPQCLAGALGGNGECAGDACRLSQHCSSNLASVLTALLAAATLQFESEHRTMKLFGTHEHFKMHSAEHGDLSQVICDAISQLSDARDYADVIASIHDFAQIFRHHLKTTDVEMRRALR